MDWALGNIALLLGALLIPLLLAAAVIQWQHRRRHRRLKRLR
jgi:hypothetical protein